MKRVLFFVFLLTVASAIFAQPRYCANPETAVRPFGVFPGYVVLNDQPTAVDLQAASELSRLLGYTVLTRKEFYLNSTLLPTIFIGWSPSDSLHDDGYAIHGKGLFVSLSSHEGKGTLYAAYRLLELMGFRLYAPDALMLTVDEPTLPVVDLVCNPSFRYREVLYYYPNHSDFYLNWHGLHNRADLARDWGMFVHTFQHLVPARDYFDSHPEWFTEIGGQRVRDGQLCLSNAEVLDTLCAHLALRMAAHPEAKIWSVSNNDNYNACQCAECRRMDSLYGGSSGTLIHFVNEVARRFPDKTISTLGYQYTRRAPRQDAPIPQQPDSNVNIMFCSIECGRQEAIATAPGEAQFRQDMHDWAALTDNIFMWDYVVQFRNFWDPFPNLQVLQPNLQLFHDNGVRLMFEQGSGTDNKTSWMDIRCYLLAKLLWDVNADVDALTRDFCRNYYGCEPAGDRVLTVLQEIRSALLADGPKHLDIYGYPVDAAEGYLRPELLRKYDLMMDSAHLAVAERYAGDPEARRYFDDHLRYFELALDYARLELTMSGYLPLDSTFLPLADRFAVDCRRMGIVNLHEMGYPVDDYRKDIDRFVAKCYQPNLARDCRVEMRTPPDARYYAKGPQGLTDGVAGILNYHNSWMGFYGDTLQAVVDLGAVKKVDYVGMDFYFYPLSWIFYPQRIEYYLSRNGRRWKRVGEIAPTNAERLAVPETRTFAAEHLGTQARYVKVVATPLPCIPQWHRATGNPVWVFTDELIVR